MGSMTRWLTNMQLHPDNCYDKRSHKGFVEYIWTLPVSYQDCMAHEASARIRNRYTLKYKL